MRHIFGEDHIGQVQEILDGSLVGEVGGINFDFRHPQLDPTIWHAPDGASTWWLVAPWDQYGPSAVSEVLYKTLPVLEWEQDHSESIRVAIDPQEDARELRLASGDKVTISRVTRFHRGGGSPPFEDEHDASERWGYLSVTRPDGSVEELGEPVIFVARDGMGPFPPYGGAGDPDYEAYFDQHRVTFEKVALRIDRLSAGLSGAAMGQRLRLAEVAASEAKAECDAVRGEGVEFIGELLDWAVAAGYALARAEVARRIQPLAEKGLKAQASLEEATKGARARTDPVRAAARKDIAANPQTTQGQCVGRVAAALGRSDTRAIARTIAPLFEWITLSGGLREKRPKTRPNRPAG